MYRLWIACCLSLVYIEIHKTLPHIHCYKNQQFITHSLLYIYAYYYIGDIHVYGMTLTVDSDLNGASPQFTLTCISTGGPATTVTWTRDSVTVTEGTVTHYDTSNYEYSHSLIVTGRLEGLYTCTVANDKPSSGSANITVQGDT